MKRGPHSDIGSRAAFSGEADHHSPQRLKTGVPLYRAILLTAVLLVLSSPAKAAELSPVSVTILNGEIRAGSSVSLDPRMVEEIREGLSKEFIYYIDLFRVWDVWPNEFIAGRKIVKEIKSDPIKRQHIAVSNDGAVRIEKRFKDAESMIAWTMTIGDIGLASVNNLDRGSYFVKVTVESKIRKLPPVIGYLLFFVPEKEFSMSRNSQVFHVQGKREGK